MPIDVVEVVENTGMHRSRRFMARPAATALRESLEGIFFRSWLM
jgi:hypothetical protein